MIVAKHNTWQPDLRALFRNYYLDSRLETYRLLPDVAAARQELTRSRIPDLSAMGQRQLKIGVYVEGSA
jgi:hypothetical protein